MPKIGWMGLKQETPVRFSDKSFYTEAQIMESKLGRLDTTSNPDKAIKNCIGHRVDFDTIIQEVLRQIYGVQNDVEEYEEAGDVMYRLIEANLKYYRKQQIDELIDPANNRGGYNSHEAEMLRTNMLKILKTIKHSLFNSIQEFESREVEELDERLVFIAILAKNIESSIRFYGEYRESGSEDDELMGLVEDTAEKEGEDAKEALDEYTDEIDDVNEALEEVEDEIEDL